MEKLIEELNYKLSCLFSWHDFIEQKIKRLNRTTDLDSSFVTLLIIIYWAITILPAFLTTLIWVHLTCMINIPYWFCKNLRILIKLPINYVNERRNKNGM